MSLCLSNASIYITWWVGYIVKGTARPADSTGSNSRIVDKMSRMMCRYRPRHVTTRDVTVTFTQVLLRRKARSTHWRRAD